jgi:hypothetical protein
MAAKEAVEVLKTSSRCSVAEVEEEELQENKSAELSQLSRKSQLLLKMFITELK